MKYIERFICSLSNDVDVKRSKVSNSVYITLDGGFKIRLSDHQSQVPVNSSIKMEILSIFKNDDFLFFMGDSHIPVVKNRKELKYHIKITYENWLMAKMKIDSDIKHYDRDKKTSIGMCKTLDDYIDYFGDKCFDGTLFGSLLGNMSIGRRTPKDIRKVMANLISEQKTNAPTMLYLLVENNQPILTLETLNKIFKDAGLDIIVK